jgi:hypothetical protein
MGSKFRVGGIEGCGLYKEVLPVELCSASVEQLRWFCVAVVDLVGVNIGVGFSQRFFGVSRGSGCSYKLFMDYLRTVLTRTEKIWI